MIPRPLPQLDDGVVALREVRREDARRLYEWRMDPQTRLMFHSTGFVSYESHLAFLERYFHAVTEDAWFVIEARGLPVGSIVLYDLSADGREAEWGRFVVAPEHRGRGFGGRALLLLLAYARERGIRRLRCDVLGSNAPARGLYRRLGFGETGIATHDGREFVKMVRTE